MTINNIIPILSTTKSSQKRKDENASYRAKNRDIERVKRMSRLKIFEGA